MSSARLAALGDSRRAVVPLNCRAVLPSRIYAVSSSAGALDAKHDRVIRSDISVEQSTAGSLRNTRANEEPIRVSASRAAPMTESKFRKP